MSGERGYRGDRADRGDDDPIPVAASLNQVMRSLSGASAAQVVGVFEAWDSAVGAAVAAHARPAALDDGVLVVTVDEVGWMTQLRYLQSTVLQRLDEAVGAGVVRSIDLRMRVR